MKLTEKSKIAFDLACEYFFDKVFCAADLSAVSGTKVAAASLTALEKKGLFEKFPTKPVTFKLVEGAKELIENEAEVKKGCDNGQLIKAKKEKHDEFYTRFEDIEAEVSKYKKYFKNKVVYLNCDDKEQSMFWKFFELNFDAFQLKKLIATYYSETEPVYAYKLELSEDCNGDGFIDQKDIVKTPLVGNGDFRSQECIEILKESDIVCTNPPFSLFREYVAQLMEYNKQFLILGNNNAVTYKEIFPLIKDNKIWLGYSCNKTMKFYVPDQYEAQGYDEGVPYVKVPAITWFTNIPNKKRSEPMVLTATYAEGPNHREDYPKYDNYDAIEVSKCKNIPSDYDGVMGVPITFLNDYCPEQFEILGMMSGATGEAMINGNDGQKKFYINNKGVYARILLKRKV
jgi:hypothetical protein